MKSENLDYLNSEEFINKTKNEILESASNCKKKFIKFDIFIKKKF